MAHFSPSRIAIALLANPLQAAVIANQQRGIAANFPVHTTIRGRFGCRKHVDFQSLVVDIQKVVGYIFPLSALFTGPVKPNSNLLWYECMSGRQGYDDLCNLNLRVDEFLTRKGLVDIDEVPEEHKEEGFRPHITIDWRYADDVQLQEHVGLPHEITVAFQSVCLFVYRTDPSLSKPSIIIAHNYKEAV